MAPSRRRGASKAAIAAAACRQWKVGDLVLAKVKGFPAWPATVSEPKAWGYKSDRKKVLVHFFGTEQIAFCNPIDVEPFTEEKKQNLQVKRPGRSADFLKAVQEIAECFEKLKEQFGTDKPASDEVPVQSADVCNVDLENSLLHTATQNSESVDGKVKPSPVVEDGTGSCEEDPSKGSAFHDISVSKFKFSKAWRTNSQAPQPSVRRCRSSRLGENGRKSLNVCAYDGFINGSTDKSNRRQEIKKGRDSNGVLDGNSSDASIGDSDTFSNNEDNAEHLINSHQVKNSMCKGLEFDTKTVILRKKRKPGRKRMATEPGVQSDLEKVKIGEGLLPSKREFLDSNSKEGGDEHLPLLKRARVRMGKTSAMDEQLEVLIERDEKHLETCSILLTQNGKLMDSAVVNGPEKCSLNVKDTLAYSSPSEGSPTILEDKSLVWKVQTFSCSYDGEAALPPSKRLHRALEAMSANAVEECQPSLVSSSCIEEDMNSSPKINSSSILIQKLDQLMRDESPNCDDTLVINTTSCPSTSEDVSVKSEMPNILAEKIEEAVICPSADTPAESNDVTGDSGSVFGIGSLVLLNIPDGKESNLGVKQCVSSHLLIKDEDKVELVVELHNNSHTSEEGPAGFKHSGGIRCEDARLLPQCNGESQSRNPAGFVMAATEEICASQLTEPSTEENLQVVNTAASQEISRLEAKKESTHIPVVVRPSSPALCVTLSPQMSCLNSYSGAKLIDQDVLHPRDGVMETETVPSPTPTFAASDTNKNLQNKECCTPDANFRDKKLDSPVGQVDTLKTIFPPTTAVDAPDDNKSLHNKGCCTPDANVMIASHLDEQIKCNLEVSSCTNSANKLGNNTEVKAALASLETTLETLTRTKESINRATRIAIDCAKFGIATEVVEILACYLERESSLHRRVDLFFLVDSIAQCSRGLKGSMCDAYLSSIQKTLPRLLAAAAPSGYATTENRRQCLKVLKLWQERRILTESVIRQHIRELDSQGPSSSTGDYSQSRRMLRTERSFDDPIREMEGMHVDEYGSNSSFQLPGLCMPRMIQVEDVGSESDEGSFEAVTPEHEITQSETTDLSVEKHRHILEDVDGELEMEDVAPSPSCQVNSTSPMDCQVPCDRLPLEPPLPKSPPPLPPPPPPPTMSHNHITRHNTQEAMPPHPRITSQMPMVRPGNDSCQLDATAYQLRPPNVEPSNQFSYFQKEAPTPFYCDRPQFAPPNGARHYYDDHERTRSGAHESWRYSRPPYHGSNHADKSRRGYGGQYSDPPYEHNNRMHDPGWGHHPRPMHHRYHGSNRNFHEGPPPMAIRAPSFWPPR